MKMTPEQRLQWRRACNRMRVSRGISPLPEDAASIEEFDQQRVARTVGLLGSNFGGPPSSVPSFVAFWGML